MIVYLSERIDPAAVERLKSRVQLVDNFDHMEEIEAIILRNIPVTAEMMDRAPKLKLIAKHGVGVNTIDVRAARERGIIVTNTPTANANAVAELVVGLVLAAERRLYEANAGCRADRYSRIAPSELTGNELTGKVLGQIGMGNIAQRAAHILHNGFDMKLLGFDPFIDAQEASKRGFEKVEQLEELIERSDVINISVPLTEGTKDLISGSVFDHFRKNAVLINASRGGIVNEEDLYQALKAGKLKAAACDAFVQEPPTQACPLLELENFSATPHIGGNSEEALQAAGQAVVDEVINLLEGKPPVYPLR